MSHDWLQWATWAADIVRAGGYSQQPRIRDVNVIPEPPPSKPSGPTVLLQIRSEGGFRHQVIIYWRGRYYMADIGYGAIVAADRPINLRTVAGVLSCVDTLTPILRHQLPARLLTA